MLLGGGNFGGVGAVGYAKKGGLFQGVGARLCVGHCM